MKSNWLVKGVDARTGTAFVRKVSADNPEAVEAWAMRVGVRVQSIEMESPPPAAPPPPIYRPNLMACPACQAAISPAAPTCPHCGHPMHQSGLSVGKLNPVHTGQIMATEKTGKGLKAQGCLSTLMLLTGVTMLLVIFNVKKRSPETTGLVIFAALLIGVSIPWMICVRILTWWRHG